VLHLSLSTGQIQTILKGEDMDGVFHKENGLAASSVEVKFSSVS
jgi:hypothetical protein